MDGRRRNKVSYKEYCPQGQKGIQSRILLRPTGRTLVPTKEEESIAISVLR